MILPIDVNPNRSLYYVGAVLLQHIDQKWVNLNELFDGILASNETLSVPLLSLGLDWLYLINAIVVKDKGEAVYVSKNA